MKTGRAMKRAAYRFTHATTVRLVLGLGLGLLTPACGLLSPAQTAVHASPAAAAATATPAALAADKAPGDSRKVGDFAVHRFSGSYQKGPLTMTEEVVANEDGRWVIDYTFEEQAGTTKLRVLFDPQTDSVVRVAKLDGTKQVVMPLLTYQNMIDRTSFAADSNDGQIASTHGTCLVGPSELDCETKSYKVWVGEKQATLNVSRSNSVPDGDVAGDITASDGTVIYRSELVEMGNASSPKLGVASR
jgi:hypothetical protein